MRLPWFRVLLLSFPLCLAACRDAEVASYRIPKENDVPSPTPAPAAAPAGMAGPSFLVASGGELQWTAPAAWQPRPGSAMRKGSYTVGGEGGADLSITAFPGDVGGDLANVNRWRGQLSLPPITEADLAAALTSVSANGLAMKVVDLAGGGQRMLGAIVPHGGSTWFFKLTGPDALVAKEKAAYLEFLQSVKAAPAGAAAAPAVTVPPAVPPAPDMASTPVVKAEGPGLNWSAPAHWQAKPASAMRKATYVVPGAGGADAELAVTAFPGDVGGELANVNRWRGQLQLPPLSAAELPGAVTRVTANGLPVTLVDLTGGPADQPVRLLGAIVPSNGATWFFKLTGPAARVAAEKPAFLSFVQTLSTP